MDLETARNIWDQWINQHPSDFIEIAGIVDDSSEESAIDEYIESIPVIFDDRSIDLATLDRVRDAMYVVIQDARGI
jgi:hypothetical protein